MQLREILLLNLVLVSIVACRNDDSSESEIQLPVDFTGVEQIRRNSNDSISIVKGQNLSSTLENHRDYQALQENGDHEAMAMAYVRHFATPFRLSNPQAELTLIRVNEDDLGYHQVRFTQNFRGVPVVYSEIIVHFNQVDHVYLLQGQYIPTPSSLDLNPAMSLDDVVAGLASHGELTPIQPSLAILAVNGGDPILVYQVTSRVSLTDQSVLLIDANSGTIVQKVPTVYNAK
jgi:Zn-dependent metalloprotease